MEDGPYRAAGDVVWQETVHGYDEFHAVYETPEDARRAARRLNGEHERERHERHWGKI